jgi:hypothetical protein
MSFGQPPTKESIQALLDEHARLRQVAQAKAWYDLRVNLLVVLIWSLPLLALFGIACYFDGFNKSVEGSVWMGTAATIILGFYKLASGMADYEHTHDQADELSPPDHQRKDKAHKTAVRGGWLLAGGLVLAWLTK